MSNSRMSSFALMVFSLSFSFLLSPVVHADGPGLPKITFSSTELFKPLSTILSKDGSGNARGNGNVAMHYGWLFVPWGVDSGHPGGGFSFYDMSNPRAPVLKANISDSALREPHGFGFSSSYNGGAGHYAVMQAINGIQFWDFTNHFPPTRLSYLTLPGIVESDYDLGAWWTFWQAPYVYVGGSGNGLYIVDAKDPKNPVFVKKISTSAWGNFRVGPTFAIGNLLVMTSMDRGGIVTMDISDPVNPKLLGTVSNNPSLYSAVVNGNRVIGAGGDNSLYVFDISNPSSIVQKLKSGDMGGKGGYVSVQGNFAHSGASNNYAKVDLTTGAIVGKGSSNITGRDEDFGAVLGNFVFVGSDHAVGSVFMPHQTSTDTSGPSVNMISPKSGATSQALTSRVGLTFTDEIDIRTLSISTFIVRKVGGTAIAGKYSTQATVVNFSPDVPLASGTQYEVVVPAGGIKDISGNSTSSAFNSSFTTR